MQNPAEITDLSAHGSGGSGGGGGSGGAAGTGGSGGGGTADMIVASGHQLPCDVEDVLNGYCRGCHSATPQGKVPMPLITHADLVMPSKSDPTKTFAQMSLTRMQSASNPMPPKGQAPADVISKFATWVNAGAPAGDCSGGSDAGAPDMTATDLGAADLAPPAGDMAAICSSGKYWMNGDKGSSSMHPGLACITCHKTKNRAPQFTAAGTLYPTAHEPNDCNGAAGTGITVTITDANKKTYMKTPNAVGNFSFTETIAMPYTVKITKGTASREMQTPQMNGDCNSCHTVDGTSGGAPGRIMTP